MNYKMDYRSLKDMYKDLKGDVESWNSALKSVNASMTSFSESNLIAGAGAEAVKLYLQTIHAKGIIPGISEVINQYYFKLCTYYNDYVKNLDTNSDCVFHSEELTSIAEEMKKLMNSSNDLESSIVKTLNSISDLFVHDRRDNKLLAVDCMRMGEMAEQLDQDIQNLETTHAVSDFAEMDQLITSSRMLIGELQAKSRSYKTNFDDASFWKLRSARPFIESCVAVYGDLKANEGKYIEAAQNTEKHVEVLDNLEREERERIANAIKIGVAAVGAAALIIVSAGTAAPLAIGGVAAITGAVGAGVNGVADSWAEHGDFNHIDYGDLFTDMLVAGATGFITGAVGGAMSNYLKTAGPFASMLGSESAGVRILGNTCIGSIKSISTGVINNTIEEAGSYFKGEGFHAEKILGLEEGEQINAQNLLRVGVKTVAHEGIESVIGEGFDVSKQRHSGDFNSPSKSRRWVEGAVEEGLKDATSGMASRTTDAIADQFNSTNKDKTFSEKLSNVIKETADIKETAKDFTSGAIEGGYEGVKRPTAGDDMYEKEERKYKGKVVKDPDTGEPKYNYTQKPEYKSSGGNTVTNDKKFLEKGGKITRDSSGNTIRTEAKPQSDHPLRDALTKGEQSPKTTFYDKDGRRDDSRSSSGDYHKRNATIGDIEFTKHEYRHSSNAPTKIEFYDDTLWSDAVKQSQGAYV